MYRILCIKCSHIINILTSNDTISLNSGLLQECSDLVSLSKSSNIWHWFHSLHSVVPEELYTRVPFWILCPVNPTQLHIPHCWVTPQTTGSCVPLYSSLFDTKPLLAFFSSHIIYGLLLSDPWLWGWEEGKDQNFLVRTLEKVKVLFNCVMVCVCSLKIFYCHCD